MFKTSDSRTAESFKEKGYKVYHILFGEWLIYSPDDKIPDNVLQIAQEQKERDRPKRKYRKRKLIRINKVIKERKKIKKLRRLTKRKRK